MRDQRSALRALVPLLLLAVAAPVQAQLDSCQVGQRVAMPVGYGGRWLNAVVIEVNQANAPFVCRAHPLGYTPYANANHMPKQLRSGLGDDGADRRHRRRSLPARRARQASLQGHPRSRRRALRV